MYAPSTPSDESQTAFGWQKRHVMYLSCSPCRMQMHQGISGPPLAGLDYPCVSNGEAALASANQLKGAA